MMCQLNIGITLASTANFNSTTPSTSSLFDVWTKKSYNPSTRTVQPSNCN